jgi:diacylglycerol kinase (ATP)
MSAARRFGRSLAAAAAGTRYLWQTRQHFRFGGASAAPATAAALLLGVGLVPVLLASALVLAAELVNTAVEAVVDLLAPERRPMAAAAKDAAAGAVLVSAAVAVAVGVAAIGPAAWNRWLQWWAP